MGVNNVSEELSNASIEEIERMAMSQLNGEEAIPGEESGEIESEAATKQDVEAAPSDPVAEVAPKQNDKEKNFAAMRTKNKSLEEELARTQNELKILSERTYQAALPENYEQSMSDVTAQMAAIGSKFQEGELSWEDYQAQLRDVTVQRENLIKASLKAEISNEMRNQIEEAKKEDAATTWEKTVGSFLDSKPDQIDYKADEAKNRDLNTYVKALAADTDNSDKSMEWFLQEAHVLVKAKHRIAASPAPIMNPVDKPSGLPFNTLSDLPGGLSPANTSNEQLDQLSGAALANRFMNDPAAIDKYLASLG